MECGIVATFTNKIKLNPYWVTGFVDGDGSFTTVLSREFKRLTLSFEISLHSKDVAILHKIKDFFCCGNVTTRLNLNRSTFRVTDLSDINTVIIPHFKMYPLYTQKQLDFALWEKIAALINESQTQDKKIDLIENAMPYIASMNRGLSYKQLIRFPNIQAVDRGTYVLPEKLNPFWMSGFVSAELELD